MVNDENHTASSGTPPVADLAESVVPSSVESRCKRFFVVFGGGVFWAVVLGRLACLCGLYDAATSATGIDVDQVRATTLIPCFEDGSVDAVAFSPNGTMLVCGGGQRGLTRVVDTNHWKIVATLRTWGGWRIHCLAFSSDGKRLATGDALTRVAIWDVMSLKLEP